MEFHSRCKTKIVVLIRVIKKIIKNDYQLHGRSALSAVHYCIYRRFSAVAADHKFADGETKKSQFVSRPISNTSFRLTIDDSETVAVHSRLYFDFTAHAVVRCRREYFEK